MVNMTITFVNPSGSWETITMDHPQDVAGAPPATYPWGLFPSPWCAALSDPKCLTFYSGIFSDRFLPFPYFCSIMLLWAMRFLPYSPVSAYLRNILQLSFSQKDVPKTVSPVLLEAFAPQPGSHFAFYVMKAFSELEATFMVGYWYNFS